FGPKSRGGFEMTVGAPCCACAARTPRTHIAPPSVARRRRREIVSGMGGILPHRARMKDTMPIRLLALAVVTVVSGVAPPHAPRVHRVSVQHDGIRRQAALARGATIHVMYHVGPATGGDLYYVRRAAGDAAFSPPIRVNSDAGSAIAAGAVRGGRIALGRNGW